jgi:CubicO group peptidase (beta-lactamase class C family)
VSEHANREVETLLRRAVRAGFAPAAVARWGRTGDTRQVAIGAAHETLFDLASLTKPLATTSLVMQAWRDGSISLQGRVDEILPELEGTAVGALVLKTLLTHTSGLPGWLPLYCLADGDPGLLLRALGRIELEAEPGKQVEYSCIGYVIVGVMLERIAGARLDRLFTSQIAGPLGLAEEIGFRPSCDDREVAGGAMEPVVERRMVRAMGLDPGLVPAVGIGLPDDGNARFLGGAAGNSGLFGTARAVWELAMQHLAPGSQLFSDEPISLAVRCHTRGLQQDRGLGWQLASTNGCSAGGSLTPEAFGHTGYSGTSVWVDPAQRSCCVLLTNRNFPWPREVDLHPLRRRFHTLCSRD